MSRRKIVKLWSDNGAAVAPTVALSLIGLITAGGVAFDYARMVAMDTELQSAADQAAIAAATQLDGRSGSISRATAAAKALVDNKSWFANDSGTAKVTVPTITFYSTYDSSTDTYGTVTTDDTAAKFVRVKVGARKAFYALTPIVSAFNSGNIEAEAAAGMGSAICKVPPLMMCNPLESGTFDPDTYKGRGIRLVETQGNNAKYGPGAFGYLNVGAANNGSPDQRASLGFNGAALTCMNAQTGDIDTGVSSSILDALNARFDIFSNGWGRNTCFGSSNCSPAMNTVKDVVRNTTASQMSCDVTGKGDEWTLPLAADQYIPSNAAGDDSTVVHMGYPMDTCHYPIGGCGRVGDGSWRRDIYFKTNHPTRVNSTGSNWTSLAGLPSNPSRYDVYKWELSASGALPDVSRSMAVKDNGKADDKGKGGGGGSADPYKQHGAPICKSGIASSATQPDRRVISVAIVTNCGALSGSSVPATIGTWMDVFLVQPAISRPDAGTNANELYVEVIGKTRTAGSAATAQVTRRDVPYLIR